MASQCDKPENSTVNRGLRLTLSTIAIKVELLPQGRVRFRISDDGKGLPVEPRASAPGSGTGVRIIEGPDRQIRA